MRTCKHVPSTVYLNAPTYWCSHNHSGQNHTLIPIFFCWLSVNAVKICATFAWKLDDCTVNIFGLWVLGWINSNLGLWDNVRVIFEPFSHTSVTKQLLDWLKCPGEYSKLKTIINCRPISTTNHYRYKANTLAGANSEPVSCCCWYNRVTCKADTGNRASWGANVLILFANQLIGTSSTGQQDSSSSVCLLTLQPLTCDHLPRLCPLKPGSEWVAGQVWFTPCRVFIINLILWQRFNGTHTSTHVHSQRHMFLCFELLNICLGKVMHRISQ